MTTPATYEAMASKLDGIARGQQGAPMPPSDNAAMSWTEWTDADTDHPIDLHRNAPKPSPDCLHGLVGEIAIAGSKDTEANPYAVALSALAYLGAAIGRGPYMPIGDDFHHTNLFYLHVGRSARGRKGTAKKLMQRIAKRVKEIDENLAPHIHRGGLSSREGLAALVHDGFKDGKNEVAPITDKRLLIIEPEFANVMHQTKREGNTLSTALREVYDNNSIKPAIKGLKVWATNPHISFIGDITPSELLSLMADRELTNGFANRIIMLWAESATRNPFPQPTPPDTIDKLAKMVIEVLQFAGADRHTDRNTHRIELSPDAAKLYARLYHGELHDRTAGERVTVLLDRRAPVLMRLAMIFALADKKTIIEVIHINAGMAWVRYWVDSVKFIFQTALDEVGVAQVSAAAEKIIAHLTTNGQSTRSELSKDCFNKHASASRIDAAIDELLTATPPRIELETIPAPKGQTGRPTKIYRLPAKEAKKAKYEDSCGFAGIFDPCEKSEVLRSKSEFAGTATNDGTNFAQVRKLRNDENPLETRMDKGTSHISLYSQGNLEKEHKAEPASSGNDASEVF